MPERPIPDDVDQNPGDDEGWLLVEFGDFPEIDQQWLKSALGPELTDPRLTVMRGPDGAIRFDVGGKHGTTSVCWSDNHPGGHWVITAGPEHLVGTAYQSEGLAVRAAMRGWVWPADWGPASADLEELVTRECPPPDSVAEIPLRDRVSKDAHVEPGLIDDTAATGRAFMWPVEDSPASEPEVIGEGAVSVNIAWDDSGAVFEIWKTSHTVPAVDDRIIRDNGDDLHIVKREWSDPLNVTLLVRSER